MSIKLFSKQILSSILNSIFMNCDKYNKKIDKYESSPNFIVFYKNGCPYSKKALDLLQQKEKHIKGYEIDPDDKEKLFGCLTSNKDKTDYSPSHRTFPTIFYRGKFIGGCDDLIEFLNELN